MLNTALDGGDPAPIETVADLARSITPAVLVQRLDEVFPVSEELLVVAVSPDAKALPEACVIERIEQADQCPYRER